MRRPRRRTVWLAAGAVLVVLAAGGVLSVARYPLINDISTDVAHPPRYLVAPPRHPAYDAAALRGPTERGYPDLHNLTTPRPPDQVAEAVQALVGERGWSVVAGGPATAADPWRLQAVATTRWLHFHDDVIIEVRPGPDGGSVVAMRSKSRVGKGDLGVNAARIRAFLADLRARLQ